MADGQVRGRRTCQQFQASALSFGEEVQVWDARVISEIVEASRFLVEPIAPPAGR